MIFHITFLQAHRELVVADVVRLDQHSNMSKKIWLIWLRRYDFVTQLNHNSSKNVPQRDKNDREMSRIRDFDILFFLTCLF